MKNKKRVISIIGIFALVLAVIGGTLAYWTWTTNEVQQTNVVFTVTSDFSCAADGGGNITNNDVSLAPTTCTDTSRAIKRKVTVTPTINRDNLTIGMDLWLNVNDIGSGLSASTNFRYVLTTSENSCEEGTIMASGNFNGKSTDDKIMLLDKKRYTKTSIIPEEYWLYIWLDEKETSLSTMNQTFNLSLGGECSDNPYKDTAYAIYSADDTSLTFYRSDEEITAGSTYKGKTATAVYTGFEDGTYTKSSEVPWNSYKSSITSVSFEDEIVPRNTAYWFSNLWICSDINNLSNLDTSQVTNMSSMFNGFGAEAESFSLDLSVLNVSNVDNMSGLFGSAGTWSSSITLNFTDWNTSNVSNMRGMFSGLGEECSNVEIVGIADWNVSNVTDMSGMFSSVARYGYGGTVKIGDLSSWNTSRVTDMSSMFEYAFWNVDTISLNINEWNTSNVTNMSNMFAASFGYDNVSSLDIGGWNTSSVTNMSGMFSNWCNSEYNCTLDLLGDISGWNVLKVTNMSSMFEYTTIDSGNSKTDISNWNTSNVTNMSNMFSGITIIDTYNYIGIHNIDLSKWDVSKVTNYDGFNSSINNQTSGSFIAPNFGA